MREIKFRVWDKEEGYFNSDYSINGDFVYGYCEGKQITKDEQKKLVFQQFTGLLDKNGKEIFEGDILENTRYEKQLVEVYWKGCIKEDDCVNGSEWIKWGGWSFRKIANDTEMTKAIYNDKIEVIGNIYQKELIK